MRIIFSPILMSLFAIQMNATDLPKYWNPSEFPEWDAIADAWLVTIDSSRTTFVDSIENLELRISEWKELDGLYNLSIENTLVVDFQLQGQTDANYQDFTVEFAQPDIPENAVSLNDISIFGTVLDFRNNFRITGKIKVPSAMEQYLHGEGFTLRIDPGDIHGHWVNGVDDFNTVVISEFDKWVSFEINLSNKSLLGNPIHDRYTGLFYSFRRPEVNNGSLIPIDTANIRALSFVFMPGVSLNMNSPVQIELKDIAVGKKQSASSTTEDIVINGNVVHPSVGGATDGFIALDISGGVAPYDVLWNYQNYTTTELANIGTGRYTVSVTDSEGNMTTETFVLKNVMSGICSIGGVISTNDGMRISDGTAVLYTFKKGVAVPISYTNAFLNGMFSFFDLPPDDYIVYFIPRNADTSSFFPTYAYRALNFANAEVVHLAGNVTSFDVQLKLKPEVEIGNGIVRGTVALENSTLSEYRIFGVDLETGMPLASNLANIPVLLYNQEQAIDCALTDEYGNYSFENIADGNYSIQLEQGGFERAVVQVSISPNGSIANADFTIGTSGIVTSLENASAYNIKVFPNPASEVIFIHTPEPCQIELYNALGLLIVVGDGVSSINVKDVINGSYILKVRGEFETYYTSVFIEH